MIRLIAVGQKMPTWVDEGYHAYAKRLPPDWRLVLQQIPLAKRHKQQSRGQLLEQEGRAILKSLNATDQIIALAVDGQAWSTEQLAQQLAGWRNQGQWVSLLIGGPDGLAPCCLARANKRWSLSPLTLPHGLVRVVVAEQIYRAWSLLKGHPYHRG
jgi:23S rRNA (pseudouridine1915-N3)-methyltransferase